MGQSTADKIYRELLNQAHAVVTGGRSMDVVKMEVDTWKMAAEIAATIAQDDLPC